MVLKVDHIGWSTIHSQKPKGDVMKPNQLKVGMKVKLVNPNSKQHYFVAEIISPFVVSLEYCIGDKRVSGGMIDVSLIKKID